MKQEMEIKNRTKIKMNLKDWKSKKFNYEYSYDRKM